MYFKVRCYHAYLAAITCVVNPAALRWIYAGPGILFVEVHGATPGPGATAELLRAPMRSTAGSSPGVYLPF